MEDRFDRESMLQVFIIESLDLVGKLEQLALESEQSGEYDVSTIQEIFRIMHTIKGSSAMMQFEPISTLAHSLEDLFGFMRQGDTIYMDCSEITDILLEGIDFIKGQISKVEKGEDIADDAASLTNTIHSLLSALQQASPAGALPLEEQRSSLKTGKLDLELGRESEDANKNRYKAIVFFEEGCGMENIRAFTIIHNLEGAVEDLRFWPQDIMENESSSERIQREGFTILFASHLPFDEIRRLLSSSSFIKTLEITDMKEEDEPSPSVKKEKKEKSDVSKKAGKKELGNTTPKTVNSLNVKQSTINVGVAKLDQLMDLMGELVIYEAMVTQNPELDGLELKNFHNSARQLKKVIHELQDVVMSIRMVPLSVVFRSMNRIVRDMCKKLGKDVQLQIAGEETEVDKNIIDHIGDPLMHIIRNAVDHGIEPPGERCRDGKSERGSIQLEAKNEGGEVIVRIQDDGRGLNKEKILAKAQEKGLVHKAVDELTDSEIFSFILLPGFSTKEEVSEYSGRGVGMDVVMKDIEKVRGSILIDSVLGKGTFITIKIPLTLAIIDGMTVRVGKGRYTIPIRAIREVFKGKKSEIIKDADGHEMVFIRDQWCPVLRLHQLYGVETKITEITNGILLVIENESCSFCLFADELLEKQQVVIKALPKFIKKVPGITGCTLLGDGSISLILDTEGIYRHVMKERR